MNVSDTFGIMEQDSDLTSITFRLPNELRTAIESAAEAEHRSVSNWLRVHLPELLDFAEKQEAVAES